MPTHLKPKQAEATLFLYVLLERISNLREYTSSVADESQKEELREIKKDYFGYFKSPKSTHKQNGTSEEDMKKYWERMLTREEVLRAEITVDIRNKDYKFGADTAKIPQQTSYKLNGETLLHFAIRIPFKDEDRIAKTLIEIIKHLVETCPRLLKWKYKGLTPLQVAVVKGNKAIVEKMVETIDDREQKYPNDPERKYPCETLPAYKGTKMMAATPLALAAVSNHRKIFDILVISKVGEKTINDTNEGGDNIYHSLIRHAHREKSATVEEDVLYWFKKIENCDWDNDRKKENSQESPSKQAIIFSQLKAASNMEEEEKKKVPSIPKPRQLWMMTNNEKLNPLQLAAKLGQFKLFEHIMKTNVYLGIESSDGLVDEEMYDITEIETLAIDYPDMISDETMDKQDLPKSIKQTSADTVDIQQDYHTSILEYVSNHDARTAFQFIRFSPMKGVLLGKWNKYQWVCAVWFFFHMVFMAFLTYTAVEKRSVLYDSPYQNGSSSTPEQAQFVYTFSNDVTIRLATIFSVLIGILYLSIECFRLLRRRFRARMTRNTLNNVVKQLKNPYSNITFKICFFVFSLILIVDSCLAFVEAQYYENYLTPYSLIIGWYLVLFFLQVWQPFSFFTVLIQRVVIDLIKFAFVMSFLLVAFSAAMFMVMQGAQRVDEDFTSFRRTVMKMLMVMVGLGDLDILFTARSSLMAVIVFVLFVLLTTILLLNALIALMSQTCTELMSSTGANRLHSYLQKLSMILYLESFFISPFIVVVGEIKNTPNRFQNNRWLTLKRRKWMKKTLNTNEKSFDLTDDKAYSVYNNNYRKKKSRKPSRRHATDRIHPHYDTETEIHSHRQYVSTYTPATAPIDKGT